MTPAKANTNTVDFKAQARGEGAFFVGFFIFGPLGNNLDGESGAPGRIRTTDHLIRSQVLYPAELRAHIVFSKALVLDIMC